ncbi:MAG: O-antigen ligase family protein, partial [Anaerolineae bacterium]
MQTKLGRICDALIEAGWLAALIATPLFFNTSSNRVFEPDKLHLLRSIALVMAVAWLVQLVDAGLAGQTGPDGAGRRVGLWAAIRRTPLALPTLVLVGAYLISTALSVVPRISLLGSYVRMQGTYTFISYVLIFFMVVTHLRTRAQLNRIFHAVILTGLPIAIYGIIQHYGLDPLPWGGDVKERVAANMGNAIFVAAYLIIALFLTLERLIDSVASLLSEEKGTTADALRAGAYLFILVVQLIAIIFTQSRGPWLGLAAGLYVFGLMGVLLLGRWAAQRRRAVPWLAGAVRPIWAAIIGLTVAGLAFLVVFNLPNSPLSHLRQQRFIGRMGTLLSTTEGTNAVRVLIWEGVVDMMLKPHPPIQQPDGTPDIWNPIRPLIGYGPESMWVAYNRFYPPDLAHYEARNASPDRSHNETFDALVRTGLLGLGVQMWLYVSIFYYALRWLGLIQGTQRRNLFLSFLAGGALLGIIVPLIADHSLRLAGIALPAGLIVGLVVYVTVDLWLVSAKARAAEGDAAAASTAAPGSGRRQLLILALFAAIVAHFVEIHFGIAIASTLTAFWTLAGVLVVVGMGWVHETEEQGVAVSPVAVAA